MSLEEESVWKSKQSEIWVDSDDDLLKGLLVKQVVNLEFPWD